MHHTVKPRSPRRPPGTALLLRAVPSLEPTTQCLMKRTLALVATAALLSAGLSLAVGRAAAATSSAASNLPSLTLAMNGKSITVGGTLQSGAVNVVSTVTQETQGRPALVRLNPGVSFAQAEAAVQAHGGDFNYLDPYGSLVFSTVANRGVTSAQTSLQAGNYVAADLSGHAHPPNALFTVTQAAGPATLPAPQATMQTIEFGFRGPRQLHDGELVRFQNDGFLVHMIAAIGAKNADTAAKLTAMLKAGKDHRAQRLATAYLVFDAGLSPGEMQQQVITAKPGIYVLACFMNTQDGREYTQLGMERTIRITK